MLKSGSHIGIQDVYILKWPRVCLTCGTEIARGVAPRQGIIESKTSGTSGNDRITAFFYIPYHSFICESCHTFLSEAITIPSKKIGGHGDLAKSLNETPEEQYFKIKQYEELQISDGPFRLKFLELNPGLQHKINKDPMAELRKKIEGLRR